MRKRLFEIIEVSKEDDLLSTIYDWFMIICILISIIPLAFKSTNIVFTIIDGITVSIFILDYVFRLITADFKLERGWKSFLLYPFTFMAIIDLISILPSISLLGNGWKILKMFRLFRTLKVFKVFKAMRYSKSMQMFINVFQKNRDALVTIIGVAVAYVLVSALIIFNVEPQTFDNFFSAVYWATVSLTTMGYGDIYPVSVPGQVVTMISSFVGIAIIALPAGVITAGFMEELSKKGTNENNKED